MSDPIRIQFAAAFETPSGDALPKRVRGVAYSGGRAQWNTVVDLATLKIATPLGLLFMHDQRHAIGRIESVNNTGTHLELDAELYSDIDDDAADIAKKARRGHPWEMSIGVYGFTVDEVPPGKTITVNGAEISGPAAVLREGTLREVSIVSIGADPKTSTHFQSAGATSMTTQNQDQAVRLAAENEQLKAKAASDAARITDLEAEIKGLKEAAATAQLSARTTEVKALFAELGREYSDEAAAVYLKMDDATYTALSADLRKSRPQLPADLQRNFAAAPQGGAPAGAGGMLLSVAKTAHGLQ